jgi:hypothetical protein
MSMVFFSWISTYLMLVCCCVMHKDTNNSSSCAQNSFLIFFWKIGSEKVYRRGFLRLGEQRNMFFCWFCLSKHIYPE